MRMVFAGTPAFSVQALQVLMQGPEKLVAVYSQPDRPAGRGRKLQASPVKAHAQAAGIPVYTPESLREPAVHAQLRDLQPDLMIVIAYGLILPKKVLAIPRLGCWNIHASLLPRWRGAAPIQRAIAAGDDETGVCLMQMEAGLDTGPVYLRRSVLIGADENAAQLTDRLASLGAEVLQEGLTQLRAGLLPAPEVQPEIGVSYAHKLDKAEAKLDWNESAQTLARRVRAFNPFPVAEDDISGERVQILQADFVLSDSAEIPGTILPGTILKANKYGIDVATGVGTLRVLQLKRAGGGVIRAADYLNARPELKC
jgi:methionyl-tRNA formyltransferase